MGRNGTKWERGGWSGIEWEGIELSGER